LASVARGLRVEYAMFGGDPGYVSP